MSSLESGIDGCPFHTTATQAQLSDDFDALLTTLMPNLQLVPDAEQRYIDNVSFCGPRSLWLVSS